MLKRKKSPQSLPGGGEDCIKEWQLRNENFGILLFFGVKQSERGVRIYARGEFLGNPRDQLLPAKNDRREQVTDRPFPQSNRQPQLDDPAWV